MKKKYDLSEMQNELTTGSVFFQRPEQVNGEKKKSVSSTRPQPPGQQRKSGKQQRIRRVTKAINQGNRPQQSTQTVGKLNLQKQLTTSIAKNSRLNQSTKAGDQLNRLGQLVGPIKAGSPPAFYLPEIINTKIDEAVKYYRETLKLKQIDRTAVVVAILADPDLWTPNLLDRLKEKVIEQFNDRKRRKLEARLV